MAEIIDVVMRLNDAVTPALTNIRNSMAQTNARVIRMGKGIESCGASITAFSNKAAAMAAPLMAAAAAGVKLASDFTNGMAKVSTLCDTTVVNMDELRKGILQVSNDTGVAVTDLAQAQYQAISAGVNASQSVDFVRQATITAKAGFTDATTAIDGLTTVLNAYGLETQDVTRISDQMLVTQNLGKTTFGELAQSIGNVIPQAASLGVSTEELFGAFAALTKNGINTAESATGLKAALTGLLKPSEGALKTAAEYGIELSAAHVQQVGFAGMLDEIKLKTGGNTEAMAKLFGSSRALTSVLALTGKASGDFKDAMAAMQNSTGATAEAYEKLLTPSERAAIAFNQLKNAGMEVSAGLAPIIKLSATMMKSFANWLNGLSESQRSFLAYAARNTVALILVTGVVGRVVSGVGRLVTAVGMIEKAAAGGSLPKKFKLIETAVQGAMKGFQLLRTASVAMLGPWGIVIAAIAAAAYLIYTNWDKVGPFFTGLWNRVKEAFSNAIGKIQPVLTKLQTGWSRLVNAFQQGTGIFGVLNAASDVLAGVLGGALGGAIILVSSLLTGTLTAAFDIIGSVVSMAIGIFGGLIDFITGVFTGDWALAWQGISDVFSSIFDGLTGILGGFVNGAKAAINSLIDGINGISVNIPSWVPGVGGSTFGPLNLPHLYKGADNWQGGPAVVHDRGAEIIDLPQGSRVIPHDSSLRNAYNMGKSSAGSSGITINISGVNINNGNDINEFARKVAERIHYEMEKEAMNRTVGAI